MCTRYFGAIASCYLLQYCQETRTATWILGMRMNVSLKEKSPIADSIQIVIIFIKLVFYVHTDLCGFSGGLLERILDIRVRDCREVELSLASILTSPTECSRLKLFHL